MSHVFAKISNFLGNYFISINLIFINIFLISIGGRLQIRSGSTAGAAFENRSAEDFLSVSYGKSRKSSQAAAGVEFPNDRPTPVFYSLVYFMNTVEMQ